MKGFYISVKNDLLEPKHYKSMREAIWLYLWLLDRMTSVNENGTGKVIGGQPVTNEMITADLGVHRNTYHKYIKVLREAGYIQTLRTPHGLVITVNKAKKIFQKSSTRTSDSQTRVIHTKRASDAHDQGSAAQTRVHVNKDNTRQYKDNTSITNVIGAKAPESFGKPEINDLFDYWAQEVGYNIESRVKQNRAAASNLVKKHGKAKLQQLIRGVALTHSDQYAPRISDFSQLQQKVNELMVWGKQKHGTQVQGKGIKI